MKLLAAALIIQFFVGGAAFSEAKPRAKLSPCKGADAQEYTGTITSCFHPYCDAETTLRDISEVTNKEMVFTGKQVKLYSPPIRWVDLPWDQVLSALCHQNDLLWKDKGTKIELRKGVPKDCELYPHGFKFIERNISVNFVDRPLEDFLILLAEVSNLNIVATDRAIEGFKVTVQRENVPWDELLDFTIKKFRLRVGRFGNIISLREPR